MENAPEVITGESMKKPNKKTGHANREDHRARAGRRKERIPAADPREILGHADIGIVHLDRDFRIAYVNPRAADMLRQERDRLQGRILLEMIPEQARPALSHDLEQCLVQGTPCGFEIFSSHPKSRWLYCSCTSSEQGLTLVIQDITHRRQVEASLRESQSRYHSLFENNHAVMLLIRPGTGQIVDANPAAVEFYGYTREQLTSMNATEINVLPKEEVFREMNRARSQQQRLFAFRHRLASGEVRDVEVYSGPIEVSGEDLLYSIIHDVTARKKAEDELRMSEERYRTLYEGMAQGVVEYDENGRLVSSNPAARRITGLDLESLKGMTIEEILNTASRTIYREDGTPIRGEELRSIGLSQTGEAAPRFVVRIERQKGGETRWILIESLPRIRSGQKKPIGFFTIFSDITQIKQFQEAQERTNERLELKVTERTEALSQTVDTLQRQREILQTVVDNIPVMLILYDSSGRMILVNKETEKVLGWSREDILGRDFVAVVYPDSGRRRQVREYMQEAGPSWRDIEMETRSGGTVHVSWFNARLSDGSLIGIGMDLSERRKMEQNLRMLAEAVENAGEGIAVLNPEGKVEYVNPAYEDISGYRHDELTGRRLADLDAYLDRKDIEEVIGYVAVHGRKWSGRQRRTKITTGEAIDISLTVTPVYDQEGRIANFIEVVRDITSEVRMQDQLAQNQKFEAIGTLAGGVAHDLKNILAPIMINTEQALMDIEEGHPARRMLEEIMQAAKIGTNLVIQILTFSRQEPREKRPMPVEPVISEAVTFLRSALPSTIDIHQQLEAKDAVVNADPVRIKQVMINLGTNAGHAMREKGGQLKVRLTKEHLNEEEASKLCPDLRAGSYVCITVSDTGEGMDEQTVRRVFEPFFTTKKPGEGTGMGLAVVHGIVKDLQGTITVRSRPGKGSIFSVLIPSMEKDREREAPGP